MEGFVEWTFEGGPKGNHLVGVTGNRARYQFGMYDIVRERVDICQFEWYRDNKILLPSQAFCLRRFFMYRRFLWNSLHSKSKHEREEKDYEEKSISYGIICRMCNGTAGRMWIRK